METAAFVMAILGCADGGARCAEARVLPTRYATVVECRAQLTRVLAQHTDLDFPTVMADCRPSRPVLARADTPRG